MVELHGGEMTVESRPGLTRFVFSLLAEKEAFPTATIAMAENSAKAGVEQYLEYEVRMPVQKEPSEKKKSRSLLIVEDNVDLLAF